MPDGQILSLYCVTIAVLCYYSIVSLYNFLSRPDVMMAFSHISDDVSSKQGATNQSIKQADRLTVDLLAMHGGAY